MLILRKLISAWDRKVCQINLDNLIWENNSCQWIEDCFLSSCCFKLERHVHVSDADISQQILTRFINKKLECKFGLGWKQSWKVYSTKYQLSNYRNIIKPWVLHQLEIRGYMQSANHISSTMREKTSHQRSKTVQFWRQKVSGWSCSAWILYNASMAKPGLPELRSKFPNSKVSRNPNFASDKGCNISWHNQQK